MFLSGDFGFIELTHAAEIVCAEVVLAISDSSLMWNDNPLPTSNRFFLSRGACQTLTQSAKNSHPYCLRMGIARVPKQLHSLLHSADFCG
jgi:hypothetical protein